MFSLQNLDKITFHIDVDVTIAIEGAASFYVAGEGGDEVRVLDQLVDVADEGTAEHQKLAFVSDDGAQKTASASAECRFASVPMMARGGREKASQRLNPNYTSNTDIRSNKTSSAGSHFTE